MNQRNGVRRSFLYPSEHENNPGFPFLAVIRVPVPDSLYKPVIFGLVMGDISAQVKYRQIDKAGNVTIHSRPVGMTSQAGISPLPDRV